MSATRNQEPGTRNRLRLAVLLSGSGTTLQNFIDLAAAGRLPVEIVLAVSSRPDAYGLERAKRAGIPTEVVRPKDFDSVDAFSAAVFARVEERGAGLVCLAGFMVRLGIPKKWHDRVMNVHPALLPAFGGQGMYGHFVHDSVLARGSKVSGATVHFVDCEYDHGPIILQKAVEVQEDDDRQALAERVQAAERAIYPEAVRLFAAGRLVVAGKRVRIIPEGRT